MPTLTLDHDHDRLFLSPRRGAASRHAAAWLTLGLLAATACGDDSGGSDSLGEGTGDVTESGSAGTLDDTGTGEEIGDPPTTWPEQIAINTNVDGQNRVGVLDLASLEVTLLSPPELDCSFGDWSPDGVYLAYECDGSLYVAWGDGANAEMVFEGGGMYEVHWSPRSDEIAFYGTRPEPWDHEIWTVSPDGSQSRAVTSGVEDLELLRWSPDGQRIVLRTEGDGIFSYVISVVDVGSGLGTALHTDEGGVFTDGLSVASAGIAQGFIAYPSTVGADLTRIWVMDLEGNRASDISGFSNRVAHSPEWSPGGTLIAWTELVESDAFLVVAQPDGSSQVSYSIPLMDTPVWSPDDTRIAGNFGGSNGELHIIDVQTGEATVVSMDLRLTTRRWRPHPAQ